MNEYEITMKLEDGRTEKVVVSCNNLPCAIEKSVKTLVLRTRKSGWKYDSHRLVKKAEQDFANTPRAKERAAAKRIAQGKPPLR